MISLVPSSSLVVIKDEDLDLEENSPPSGGLLNWTTWVIITTLCFLPTRNFKTSLSIQVLEILSLNPLIRQLIV